jgi:glyoxylase-like metal-dependent hydrolase (beta-lactamase superfamily II)
MKIPLKNNPLGYINSYLLVTDEGCMLIDSGWNAEDAFAALERGLAEAGVTFRDIKHLIVTHIHPDHYGLVGRLQNLTDADLILHEIESQLLDSRYVNYDDLLVASENWLRINGVSLNAAPTLQRASLEILGLVSVSLPNHLVSGGETITLGNISLEVLWTPGHSPGHICLYDKRRKLLFSGDHVLESITPNVSMNIQTQGNPLVDYQNSLRQIKSLPVDMVLPGHGNPFFDLPTRLDAILAHHAERLQEALSLCTPGPITAFEVARNTTWFRAWDDLPLFSQRTAVTETLSHLELLLSRGQLRKTTQNGIFFYSANCEPGTTHEHVFNNGE